MSVVTVPMLCVLSLLAVVSLQLPLTAATSDSSSSVVPPPPPPHCWGKRCPRPLCANPVTPPGQCCPSCENSNCKFKGCVNFRPGGGVRWAETPCIVCQCDVARNQKFCFIIDCFFPTREQCFGRPVITRPNECCPTCDFGVPPRRCGLVPQVFGRQNITVSSQPGFGRRNCTEQVVRKGCDKIGFRAGKRRFRCQPIKGKRLVRFDQSCPLCVGTYRDNVRCRAVRDDDLIVGCDLIVK